MLVIIDVGHLSPHLENNLSLTMIHDFVLAYILQIREQMYSHQIT